MKIPKLKFRSVQIKHLKKGMFIRLRWIDCQSCHGWNTLKEAENLKLDPIETVGWIISIHKDRIIICHSFGSNKMADCPMTIPVQVIKKIYMIEGMGFDIDHGPPSEI